MFVPVRVRSNREQAIPLLALTPSQCWCLINVNQSPVCALHPLMFLGYTRMFLVTPDCPVLCPAHGRCVCTAGPHYSLIRHPGSPQTVRLYDVGNNILRASNTQPAPVLDCCFSDVVHGFRCESCAGLPRCLCNHCLGFTWMLHAMYLHTARNSPRIFLFSAAAHVSMRAGGPSGRD